MSMKPDQKMKNGCPSLRHIKREGKTAPSLKDKKHKSSLKRKLEVPESKLNKAESRELFEQQSKRKKIHTEDISKPNQGSTVKLSKKKKISRSDGNQLFDKQSMKVESNLKFHKKKKYENQKNSVPNQLYDVQFVKQESNVKQFKKKNQSISESDQLLDRQSIEKELNLKSSKTKNHTTTKSNPFPDKQYVESDNKKNASTNDTRIQDGVDKRTVFIGNLPVNFNKKKILKLLKQYGEVESMRTRGAIPWIAKLPKKTAIHKHSELPNEHPPLMVYALFKTAEDAKNALKLNGEMYDDHRLRVTLSKQKTMNVNEGVFVGNLPFSVNEDTLYKLFEQCGKISSVRLIRNPQTGAGKGFGYVNFSSADSVELALQLDGVNLESREIRVQRLLDDRKKKKAQQKKINNLLKSDSKKKSDTSFSGKIKTVHGVRDKLKKKKKKILTADERKKKILARKLQVKIEGKVK